MRAKANLLRTMAVILAMGAGMNAAAGLFGLGGTSWKEEVLLHDGTKIIVERWHKRGGRHEMASGPPIKEQGITFSIPGTGKTLTWHDEYSEDVGSANFELLALHIQSGTPYIVLSAYGCISYNKWMRPNPPYVIFKYGGAMWQRIQMAELPTQFKDINLVIDTSNNEKRLGSLGNISVEQVRGFNSDYKQPEYQTILRAPLPQERINQMCEERVLYKGSWILPNDPVARQFIDQQKK
jgi:hypothetical protein